MPGRGSAVALGILVLAVAAGIGPVRAREPRSLADLDYSAESVMRWFQEVHEIVLGETVPFPPNGAGEDSGPYPEDGFYGGVSGAPGAGAPASVFDHAYYLLFEGNTSLSSTWRGTIADRFLDPSAVDELAAGKLGPADIRGRTVARIDERSWTRLEEELDLITKIELIVDRLGRLRYLLKPLAFSTVRSRAIDRHVSLLSSSDPSVLIETALLGAPEWEESSVSPSLDTLLTQDLLGEPFSARARFRYFDHQVRYVADLEGIRGDARAFVPLAFDPGNSSVDLPDGELLRVFSEGGATIVPDGRFRQVASARSSGAGAWQVPVWVGRGEPFFPRREFGLDVRYRFRAEGVHRERYPDVDADRYGPFALVELDLEHDLVPPGEGGCDACSCEAGSLTAANDGGIEAFIGLGRDDFGRGGGSLVLERFGPVAAPFTPEDLRVAGGDGFAAVRDPSDGTVTGYEAPAVTVAVERQADGAGFALVFRERDAGGGGQDPAALGSSEPIATIMVTSGSGGDGDSPVVRLTRLAGGDESSVAYRRGIGTDAWVLERSDAAGETTESVTAGPLADDPAGRIEIREERDAGGVLVRRSESEVVRFAWGEEEVARRDGEAGGGQEERFRRFFLAHGGPNDGLLHQENRAGGGWTRFEYDDLGRVTREIHGFLDEPPPAPFEPLPVDARLVTIETVHLGADGAPAGGDTVAIIERTDGHETGRRYVTRRFGTSIERIARVPGSPPDGGDHLVTETAFVTTGPFRGEVGETRFPDGTIERREFSVDDDGAKVVVTRRGVPDEAGTGVVDGTVTTERFNGRGTRLLREVVDAASGLVVEFEQTTRLDALGRSEVREQLGGRSESTEYGCCAALSRTDADGLTTSFHPALPFEVPGSVLGGDDGEAVLLKGPASIEAGIARVSASAGRMRLQARVGRDGSVHVASRAEVDAAGRTVLVEQAGQGVTTTRHGFDEGGRRVVTHHLPGGGTRVEHYFADGRLRSVTGTAVQPVRFEYSAGEGTFSVLEIELDAEGNDAGAWRRTIHDMLGNRVRIEEAHEFAPSGVATTQLEYDAAGRLASVTDPDGTTTLTAYDAMGRREVSAVDVDGNGVIDFAGSDRITRSRSRFRRSDTDGDAVIEETVTEVWPRAGEDAPEVVRVEQRSVDGLERRVIEEGGAVTSSRRIPLSPGSWEEVFELPGGARVARLFGGAEGDGRLRSETVLTADDEVAEERSFTDDPHGRLVRIEESRGRSFVEREFDGQTDRIAVEREGVAASSEPAAAGAGENPAPGIVRTTRRAFDGAGRLVEERVEGSDGTVIEERRWKYSKRGLLESAERVGGPVVEWRHDDAGRPIRLSVHGDGDGDPEAISRWTWHPASGLLESRVFPNGDSVRFDGPAAYTPGGRVRRRTTRGGAVETRYRYDAAGDLAAITYSDATPEVFVARDRTGAIVELVDGAGTRRFERTPAGRRFATRFTGGLFDGAAILESPDAVGRRSGLVLEVGGARLERRFRHDSLGRLVAVDDGDGGAIEVAFQYEGDATIPARRRFAASGSLVGEETLAFDAGDRLASIEWRRAGGELVAGRTIERDPAGRRHRLQLDDGTDWALGYDPAGRLVSAARGLRGSDASLPGWTFAWEHDALDNRTRFVRSSPVAGEFATATEPAAGGDPLQLGRVLAPGIAEIAGTVDPAAAVALALEDGTDVPVTRRDDWFHAAFPVDNRHGAVALTATITAVIDGAQESVQRRIVVPPAEALLVHDADGNLVSDGMRRFEWDAESRLVAVESITDPDLDGGAGGWRVEFLHDSAHRCVQRRVLVRPASVADTADPARATPSWLLASEQRFLHDGTLPLADLAGADHVERSYLWGPDAVGTLDATGGVGGLAAVRFHDRRAAAADLVAFTVRDGNGNVAGLVDAHTGTRTATFEYDPFGRTLRASGPLAARLPLRFSTKRTDPLTGLVDFGRRTLDPELGRWLSRDPLGESGGLNLYAFAGNDPVNHFDLLGYALYAFDGTTNDRAKADWIESAPTNVSIMADLYREEVVYKHGVGARTDVVLGSIGGRGATERLEDVYSELTRNYCEKGDKQIDVIGFSRGAAMARVFANVIAQRMPRARIRFLGIFDTVAQFGVVNRYNFQYGFNLDIPSNVGYVAHAVARNDFRILFPLTSVSTVYQQNAALAYLLGHAGLNEYDPSELRELRGRRYWEKPFVGSHSDVGGGYVHGRNLFALRWMIKRGQARGAPFDDLEAYVHYDKLRQISEPTPTKMPVIDFLQDDRVIYSGNLNASD